jgi:hypothetical protein
MDHLMAEKEQNNKDSQKGQVTPKKIFKKKFASVIIKDWITVSSHKNLQKSLSNADLRRPFRNLFSRVGRLIKQFN